MIEPDRWDSVLGSVRGTIVRGGSERISSNRLLDSQFTAGAFVAPTIGSLTAPSPAPVAPAAPATALGQSWRGPADGPCPWLRKVPPAERRVNGGPPQTKSGAETKAQMERVNADKSIEHRIMGAPKFSW